MKRVSSVAAVSFVVVLLVAVAALSELRVAEAVTCNPTQLSPCVGAITSSAPPSRACCDKLREQRPCLCGYLRDPNLKQFVNSPNARKVSSTCGVPYPQC
ncbi:non-specific lipid-transfer protein 2 [Melia azedarach]|uniref:Non-specific lipid-transfer protein 2 n=1 Tax=Melia azedarach TaxID=155640 RepID=A0ACC1X7G7_MELAZ|nr:non-specific lipid-transfer protein 2 [Melia azedarach]